MKTKYIALSMAFALAIALTGCSADRVQNSAGVGATNSPSATNSANQPSDGMNTTDPGSSAGMGNDARNSAAIPTPDVNDAEDGGGAGGTNDVDNDGQPESEAEVRSYTRRNGGLDDQGNIVGDMIQDAGDAVRDVGDDIGNGVDRMVR